MDSLNLNEESHGPCQVNEHVDNNTSNGLLPFKVQPTWKRLARMVYGPDELNEANPFVLGKRDTKQKGVYAKLGSNDQV